MAISFPNAATCGTQFKHTTKMKYKLANRWNCSNRFFGIKVINEYFVVLILLDLKVRFGWVFAVGDRSE